MGEAYIGLFLAAFGAATLLPLQSEALLVGLLLSDRYGPWLLLAVATLGNVLGSLVNWWLGTRLEQFKGRRWFPISPPTWTRPVCITDAMDVGRCCSVGYRSLATR